MSNDGHNPTVEDYLRATAAAVGVQGDAVVSAWSNRLAEHVTPYTRATLHVEPSAHGHLVEDVADLLDNALHLEGCYITPDETVCVCIIGQLRALLPRCEHTEMVKRFLGGGVTETATRRCLRTLHPSAAWKHVYGEV